MDAPDHREVYPAHTADIIEYPSVGGLHHYYLAKAA
jgi:hypothetical protein